MRFNAHLIFVHGFVCAPEYKLGRIVVHEVYIVRIVLAAMGDYVKVLDAMHVFEVLGDPVAGVAVTAPESLFPQVFLNRRLIVICLGLFTDGLELPTLKTLGQ